MKDNSELYKIAEAEWVKTTTWNLTREQFLHCSFVEGDNGNGEPDRGGDEVHKTENGSVLTRYMCDSWLQDCTSFCRGFVKALEYVKENGTENL